jgi:hypothetical protein
MKGHSNNYMNCSYSRRELQQAHQHILLDRALLIHLYKMRQGNDVGTWMQITQVDCEIPSEGASEKFQMMCTKGNGRS